MVYLLELSAIDWIEFTGNRIVHCVVWVAWGLRGEVCGLVVNGKYVMSLP